MNKQQQRLQLTRSGRKLASALFFSLLSSLLSFLFCLLG